MQKPNFGRLKIENFAFFERFRTDGKKAENSRNIRGKKQVKIQ